jgi:hypothetical protein
MIGVVGVTSFTSAELLDPEATRARLEQQQTALKDMQNDMESRIQDIERHIEQEQAALQNRSQEVRREIEETVDQLEQSCGGGIIPPGQMTCNPRLPCDYQRYLQRRIRQIFARVRGNIERIMCGGVQEPTTGDQVCIDVGQHIEIIARQLECWQLKTGPDAGTWAGYCDCTARIVSAMVSAYEATGNKIYKTCAELGGHHILCTADSQLCGMESYALARLSQIADNPCDNLWRTALSDFYRHLAEVYSTERYICEFLQTEPFAAVLELAHHAVAVYYINAPDKELWRQALVDCLARVDDCSTDFPVMSLGIATWALTFSGPLDDKLIDPSGTGAAYWRHKRLCDLPHLLLNHQVPTGAPYAGSFYRRFDHRGGCCSTPVGGYTDDTIWATLGLIGARKANPALHIDDTILAVQQALTRGIDSSTGRVFGHLWQRQTHCCLYSASMLHVLAAQTVPMYVPAVSAIVADRLKAELSPAQSLPDPDDSAGQGVLIPSITSGMAGAYQATGNSIYKAHAELGGDYILCTTDGQLCGTEVYALARLSEIADNPCDNLWRTALSDFYQHLAEDYGTDQYIYGYLQVEPYAAVLDLAHHVAAVYHVNAPDKELWRQALIDCLARIDDASTDLPVMSLGIATWALALTGPLDDTLIDPCGTGAAYWRHKRLCDLPHLLLSHQVPTGRPYAGSFFRRFDHGGYAGPGAGYTQDAIWATLGLIGACNADPALDIDAAILAAQQVLTCGIDNTGKVFGHLWQRQTHCPLSGANLLEVLLTAGHRLICTNREGMCHH